MLTGTIISIYYEFYTRLLPASTTTISEASASTLWENSTMRKGVTVRICPEIFKILNGWKGIRFLVVITYVVVAYLSTWTALVIQTCLVLIVRMTLVIISYVVPIALVELSP